MTTLVRRLAYLAIALLPGSQAWAYFDFVPTPTEWTTWPEYCRVQYSSIMSSRDSEYADAYPPAEFDRLKDRLGVHAYYSLHHFCAGLHWINRARVETDPGMRRYLLQNALEETLFTYKSAEHASVVFPDIAISLAKIRRELGQVGPAIEVLEKAIKDQPERVDLYGTLALLHRDQNHPDKAKEVLMRADALSGGQSAEVQYTLGLINLEIGDVDAAVKNAARAYELGYPLPWLKNKLRALGKWPPAAQELNPTAAR